MAESLQVQDLGELGLLQRLRRFCPTDLIGDDAAVLDFPANRRLVVTTDVLVEGVHFSDRTTAPEDVGWRSIAANLSDLAAMGADPLAVTVGLSLPGSLPVAWVEGLYRGMGECLQTFGGEIIGGDLCRAQSISVAITAIGLVGEQALYRTAAQPGQAIIATGYHGSSRAGLEILLHPERSGPVATAIQQRWIQAHRRPQPRFDAVALLRELWPAGAAVAAMDTSDGLANAVVQVTQMSEVGAEMVRSQLPIDPALLAWQPDYALDWALYGGEDFELVLCLPQDLARQMVQRLGGQAAIVGHITATKGVVLVEANHSSVPITLEGGFQHF